MAKGFHTVDLPLKKINSGKVRDIYDAGDNNILIVTSDRLSAFDVILSDPITGKGEVLNRMAFFWFDHFSDRVPNVVVERDPSKMECLKGVDAGILDMLNGRVVLMKRVQVFPVECIVRGWLIGSGYKDYTKTGKVCGIELPKGLNKADRLPEPLFTPSTKADEGHDENISYEEVVKIIGEEYAAKLRDYALMLYSEAAEYARERGVIIADTKFEFGKTENGEVVLIDEVLTPDSSRFWPADAVVPGENPPSYDKQIVRDWLEGTDWDKTPPAPKLPDEIVEKTSNAYWEIFECLTDEKR